MDVFNHFSCHTRLPVLLDHVIEHILESKVVDRVDIHPLDIDPTILKGFCIVFDERPHNSINHHRVAWIGYSSQLSREEQRLVVCKELLHVYDRDNEAAGTQAQVSDLIEEIVLPPTAKQGIPALNDRSNIMLALAVMLPRDAMDELRPKVESGEITIATVAKLAALPEPWVRVVFSPAWPKVMEALEVIYPLNADSPPLPLSPAQ